MGWNHQLELVVAPFQLNQPIVEMLQEWFIMKIYAQPTHPMPQTSQRKKAGYSRSH